MAGAEVFQAWKVGRPEDRKTGKPERPVDRSGRLGKPWVYSLLTLTL
jgi:hypothetical protein